MDQVLFIAGLGVIGLIVLNIFLHKVVKMSPLQSATISALISLAVLIPASIVDWPGGDVFSLYFVCNLVTCYAYASLGKNNFKNLKAKDSNRIHWAPLSIFAFFVMLIIVDGTFITLAEGDVSFVNKEGKEVVSKFNGPVTLAFQKNEAAFNAYQEQIKAQKERGWQIKYGFLNDPIMNEENLFIVEVLDKKGQPIEGAEVITDFIRPSDRDLNHSLSLVDKGNGRYETSVTLIQAGTWRANIVISKGEDVHKLIGASTHVARTH